MFLRRREKGKEKKMDETSKCFNPIVTTMYFVESRYHWKNKKEKEMNKKRKIDYINFINTKKKKKKKVVFLLKFDDSTVEFS